MKLHGSRDEASIDDFHLRISNDPHRNGMQFYSVFLLWEDRGGEKERERERNWNWNMIFDPMISPIIWFYRLLLLSLLFCFPCHLDSDIHHSLSFFHSFILSFAYDVRVCVWSTIRCGLWLFERWINENCVRAHFQHNVFPFVTLLRMHFFFVLFIVVGAVPSLPLWRLLLYWTQPKTTKAHAEKALYSHFAFAHVGSRLCATVNFLRSHSRQPLSSQRILSNKRHNIWQAMWW